MFRTRAIITHKNEERGKDTPFSRANTTRDQLKMNEMLDVSALKSSASTIILKDAKENILLMNTHLGNLNREIETIKQS